MSYLIPLVFLRYLKMHRPLPVLLVDFNFSHPSVNKPGNNIWMEVLEFLWQSIGFTSWMELPPYQLAMLFPSRYLHNWVPAKAREPTHTLFHSFPGCNLIWELLILCVDVLHRWFLTPAVLQFIAGAQHWATDSTILLSHMLCLLHLCCFWQQCQIEHCRSTF